METKGLVITFSWLMASVCLIFAGSGLNNNYLIAFGVLGCCAWISFTIWFVNSKYGS